MFFQKYKGFIMVVLSAVIHVVITLYFENLEYIWRVAIKLFAIVLFIIGWYFVFESNRYYKKTEE
ncbi:MULTISPECIES: hypothetical protein [unclassified Bacillus (in: firmicutes)]|uniref:hypothetical protein n=1 Tax=unclassified Bacillus (in: firmicutes) TaxID=185979 RepID=UPI0008F08F92|nr:MULTISPECIES: hypothetical protein [unclassified Bacillus (in: firmicutes)]SFI05903.1 hypothetical protein SAMN04488574_101441 [Bacillus sp. 71mf]SFS79167.1 hypothetical protein SAMN04488145_103336 [Bacillus sp. 103mf]